MKEYIEFTQVAAKTISKMTKGGVFLTAKDGDTVNTMTIGWGGINCYWGKPIFQAPVRDCRYTYDIINNSGEFTVSVPIDEDDMAHALKYVGTHSGRDEDKIARCNIKLIPGEKVSAPIIGGCSLHFECKVVGYTDIKGGEIDAEIDEKCYPLKDYHRIYFGEIVNCYLIK